MSGVGDNSAGGRTLGDDQQSWPKAVIFDLDGTLLDSAPDVRVAINAAYAPLGVPPFPLDAVRAMIGGGGAKAIERANKAAGIDVAEIDEEALYKRFMDVYFKVSQEGRGLYPGGRELLEGLRNRSIKLALCTNKAAHITAAATSSIGIEDLFDCIIGASDDLPKKPNPQILLTALDNMQVRPQDAIMIGDSSVDVGAARAAGLPIITMSYGYTSDSQKLGSDLVIDYLAQVPEAISSLAPTASYTVERND